MHTLTLNPADTSTTDAQTLSVQLLRTRYAIAVAEALYRAAKLSPHAVLSDIPVGESRTHFLTIAEAAVMLACDEELRECAELYAAEALFGPLNALSPGERLNKVRATRHALRAYQNFLTGAYPSALAHYRKLVKADRAALATTRAAFDRGLSIGQSIVRRFFPSQDGK
jgi:hypothetical protein